jgi:dicarboxylate/amino acid:cation (Na+ or H+) symporter, DAACS family
MPLHTKIFIGLILGAIVGVTTQALSAGASPSIDPKVLKDIIDGYVQPLGSIFLYLIFMIVIPLLLSALILGVAEIGQAKRFGKVGLKSLVMTIVLSGIAVIIGLTAVNIVRPGEQLSSGRDELIAKYRKEDKEQQFLDTAKKTTEDPPLLGFIPKNPIKETARDGLLPFMFFALMLGLALAAIEAEKALPVINFFEGVFAASLKIIEWAMKLAPYGVFLLIFAMTAQFGIELLKVVALYAVLVLVCLAIHLFGVYSIVLKLVAKRSPIEFFRQIRTVMLTAFATSSSNATLPVALESAQKDVGLPRDISSFVLTVGATANQNGTALFEGITILFLAQLFGVDLTLVQQLQVMGMAIVAGIGTAGVPGGAWPFIATILVTMGIPIQGIGLVYGIDRILDMSRTVLNVTGDITIAACVTQMEHRTDQEVAAALA